MIKWGWLKASHPPNTFARTTSNSHPQGDSQKPYWIMHLVSRKYSYKIPLIPRNQENMGKKRWGQNLLYHSVDFIVKAGNSLVEVFTCVHVCTYVYVFRPMFVHLLIILILKEELQAQSTTWFTIHWSLLSNLCGWVCVYEGIKEGLFSQNISLNI